MSYLTRRNRIPHEEPKEETPDVNGHPIMVEMSTGNGETRIPTAAAPVVGTVQEFSPELSTDIQGLERGRKEEGILELPGLRVPKRTSTKGRLSMDIVLQWAPKTRGAFSRGKPRLQSSLNALLYALLISTVLWGLLKINGYQVSVPYLCSFHSQISFDKPLRPDVSPWTDLLSIENDMFEHLFKDMVVGYSMSMDVMDAQTKITDLRAFIRASGRSQKELLVNDLSALISEAKKSRKDLQTFAANIAQSLERIMGTNDWAFQRVRRVTAKEYPRVLGIPLKTMETSITRDFEGAMNVLHKSLEVMGTDVESNARGLQRIDEDLKAIVRSIRRSDEDSALACHSSKADEPSTKQFESSLQGLSDLESFAHQATYVIDSADTVIRDAKQQLEAMRSRLDWRRAAWSALNAKHIKPIAVGLEKLEEQRVRMASAQEDILTRQLVGQYL